MEVHGEGGAHREPVRAYAVGLWKNIMRVLGKFSCHTKFKVGDGFKVRLWHDLWCRDKALKEVFPNLYGIACAKDASVQLTWSSLVAPINGK